MRPATTPTPRTTPPTRRDALAWLGLMLTLTPWLVRATTNITTLPAWDLDPLSYASTPGVVTPMWSMGCDGVSLLGSAMLFAWAVRRSIAIDRALVLLAVIGSAAVILHGWALGPANGTLGDQRIGAAWLSAIFGAVALWHAGQDLRIRRIAAGVLLGFVALLALSGAVQVFWSHPETVRMFNADPGRMLAAHGWTPESPMAKAFVRRLMQPEASGWFGLANVYASFAAAGIVAGTGLQISAACSRRFGLMAAMAALTGLGAVALGLAHAKGGYMAAGGGLAGIVLLHALAKRPFLHPDQRRLAAGVLGLGAIAAPIALIIARGWIGERVSELSLFFRWFYIETASRIFFNNPVVGVGPDGFQRAFTAAKPALCPEEVSSPHGILFDWTATLGVLGVAWVCILARFAWRAGADTADTPAILEPSAQPAAPSRVEVRAALIVPAAATILAALVESAMVTPEAAFVRIAGLGLWCGAAWAIASAIDGRIRSRIALACAAFTLIAHAQIDVTASFAPSAGLWAALIALAAAPSGREAAAADRRGLGSHAPVLLCAALAGLLIATAAIGVRPWERSLFAAAETVRPIADMNERIAMLSQPAERGMPAPSPGALARDLSALLGRQIDPSRDGIGHAMVELEQRLLPLAAEQLEQAFAAEPSDRRPLREASRLHLRLADHATALHRPDGLSAELDRALNALRLGKDGGAPPGSSDWHWLASLYEHAAALLNEPEAARESIEGAVSARLEVVRLDPHNLENAKHLLQDYLILGKEKEAWMWAARCLALNHDMRLDSAVRGLSEQDRADIERIARHEKGAGHP